VENELYINNSAGEIELWSINPHLSFRLASSHPVQYQVKELGRVFGESILSQRSMRASCVVLVKHW
jgi:hypothetical protein